MRSFGILLGLLFYFHLSPSIKVELLSKFERSLNFQPFIYSHFPACLV